MAAAAACAADQHCYCCCGGGRATRAVVVMVVLARRQRRQRRRTRVNHCCDEAARWSRCCRPPAGVRRMAAWGSPEKRKGVWVPRLRPRHSVASSRSGVLWPLRGTYTLESNHNACPQPAHPLVRPGLVRADVGLARVGRPHGGRRPGAARAAAASQVRALALPPPLARIRKAHLR